ncbi:hypothetical protein BGY98DRAFT_1130564 [Russula aff. rugulosa BPL654]|nr:hypothetical protein BGY98DRAFT_1130564 [Russula aff. rugulosa BPL654]
MHVGSAYIKSAVGQIYYGKIPVRETSHGPKGTSSLVQNASHGKDRKKREGARGDRKPWRVQGSAVGAPGSRRMVATRDFLSGKLIRSPPEMTAPRTQPCARARKRILVDDWRTERIIAPFYATVPIIKYAEHPRSPDRAATLSIVTWSRRAKRRKRENVHGNGPRSRKTVQAIWSVGCMMVCAFHHPPSFTPDPRHRAGAGGWTSVADSEPGLAPLSFSEKANMIHGWVSILKVP